jgi:hypothetical protein
VRELLLRTLLLLKEGRSVPGVPGVLGETKSTTSSVLDAVDLLSYNEPSTIAGRADVPHYSLKRYLRGDSLVDVIFGTPRTVSWRLARKDLKGGIGNVMDYPSDFFAGDGYIELVMWRNRRRFDKLWARCTAGLSSFFVRKKRTK